MDSAAGGAAHSQHLVLVVGDVADSTAAVLTTRLLPAGVIPVRPLLRKPAALARVIEVIERHCPRRTASAVA